MSRAEGSGSQGAGRQEARTFDALEAAGAEPKFTVYPEAGHDSWTETYANEELYDWLLQQRRGG